VTVASPGSPTGRGRHSRSSGRPRAPAQVADGVPDPSQEPFSPWLQGWEVDVAVVHRVLGHHASATFRSVDFWEVALDGWVGAVAGALASVGVAIWVLRRTLAHDRAQFLDQLEAERELAIEQRRLESFGEIAAWGRRVTPTPVGREQMLEVQIGLVGAMQSWRTFLPASVDPVANALEALCFSWLNRAWRRQRNQAKANATLAAPHRKGMVVDEALGEELIGTMIAVRRWHQGTVDDETLTARLRTDLARSNAAMEEIPE
jgi:hypothetical protein